MTAINCLVVEDDDMDRLIIEELILQLKDLTLLGSFSNPLECESVLKIKKIDLLLMDIDMPVISGIDYIKTLSNPPLCIFTTSYPEYALEAFDIHAFDYLIKPIRKERFDKAIERASEYLDIHEKALHYEMDLSGDMLTIKDGTSINRVLIKDIIYLEALANYTKVMTATSKYITLLNLKSLLDALPPDNFVRVHRSYAVARNKITRFQSGEFHLGNYKVPIGKTYKATVNKIIG
jgi:DNA-binding LytR/AlgR family response regulator